MSPGQSPITPELRNGHLENVEKHIISGLELDDSTLTDLQAHPEAFSGVVNRLGVIVRAGTNGRRALWNAEIEGMPERYVKLIDTLIESMPGSPEALELEDAKTTWLGETGQQG